METTKKKWYEYPLTYPPVGSLVLVEFDTARDEWYKGIVLGFGDDADGEYCQFRWCEGPNVNKNHITMNQNLLNHFPLTQKTKNKKIHQKKKRVLTIF